MFLHDFPLFSRDFDVDGFLSNRAAIFGPLEFYWATRGGFNEKGNIRVGGNRRMPIRPKHLLATVRHGEFVDDFSRNLLPRFLVFPEAGFHLMRNQRLDFEPLALLDGLRHFHSGFCHF